FTNRAGVKRDIKHLLKHAVERDIPLIIGSCGGSGDEPHLQWTRDIVEEIAKEEGYHFPMALIRADVSRKRILKGINKKSTSALGGLPELTAATVRNASAIVAQMGCEPIIKAVRGGARVILAGRAYDPAVFAALPILNGFPQGLAIHMGKILECAAIAATPGSGADCVLGILKKNSFILRSMNPERKFTHDSVAAHSLYEKSDPYMLPGPGGVLDLTKVKFEEIGNGEVEVSGSVFVPSVEPAIKLEGVARVGFRTLSIAGCHDPIMIKNIDSILDEVGKNIEKSIKEDGVDGRIFFHVYGKNGVMGKLEPKHKATHHELGIVIEAIGKNQYDADTICSLTRSTLLHYGYRGRVSTAGNLALPFSPSDFSGGAVYEFSIYHLMQVTEEEMESLFPVEFIAL
ncbi:MAG: acyclic terpene utilization AtuA family protein, partial [Victivallaceae bacterium]|nr:acyclic terpene utilization AtuA family protein [Victivallaceae bacterium]